MEQINYDYYADVSKVCIANAEQLLKDAILLRENNSFGHALSLSILGFEELGKAFFAFNIYTGSIKEQIDLIKIMNEKHIEKQKHGWQFFTEYCFGDLMFEIISSKHFDEFKAIINLQETHLTEAQLLEIEKISEEKNYREILELCKVNLKIIEINNKLFVNQTFLNNQKNNGLYVGFNNTSITNYPQVFTINDTKFIDLLQFFIDFANANILHILLNKDLDKAKEIMNFWRTFNLQEKIPLKK